MPIHDEFLLFAENPRHGDAEGREDKERSEEESPDRLTVGAGEVKPDSTPRGVARAERKRAHDEQRDKPGQNQREREVEHRRDCLAENEQNEETADDQIADENFLWIGEILEAMTKQPGV